MDEKFADALAKLDTAMGQQFPTPAAPAAAEFHEGQKGNTVNWTNYDIELDHLPLYERAVYMRGMWQFPTILFKSVTGGFGDTETSLARRLEEAVNVGGWRNPQFLPNGAGSGAAILTNVEWTPLPPPILLRDESQSAPDNITVEEAAAALAIPSDAN